MLHRGCIGVGQGHEGSHMLSREKQGMVQTQQIQQRITAPKARQGRKRRAEPGTVDTASHKISCRLPRGNEKEQVKA